MSGREELMVGGKPLSSLRVVDLKAELDKLGLSKSGSKKELADRLKNHLVIEREREGAVASTGDEEELPNIAIQDKLAEDNPFIREYFASQAELYHSQKVVKKLYQEEKIRESEGSGTSADEREKSPVKVPREREAQPDTTPSSSPTKQSAAPAAKAEGSEVKNGEQALVAEKVADEPPPVVPSTEKVADKTPVGPPAEKASDEPQVDAASVKATDEPPVVAASKKATVEPPVVPASKNPPAEPPVSQPEKQIATGEPESLVSSSKSPEQKIVTEEPESESSSSESSENEGDSVPEPSPEPKPVIAPTSPVKEVRKPVATMKETVEQPALAVEARETVVESGRADIEENAVLPEAKGAVVSPNKEKSTLPETGATVVSPSKEKEPVIETKEGVDANTVPSTETPVEELAPPAPKKQAISKPTVDKAEKENVEVEKKPRRIPITFDKEDTKVKKGPIRTISFTKDEGKVVVQPASKRMATIPPTDSVPPVTAPTGSQETKPGLIRTTSTASRTSSDTPVPAPDETLDYGEEGAEAEKEEEINIDDLEDVVYEYTPRIMKIKPNIHSRKREEMREKAEKENPALTGWPGDPEDEELHFDLTTDLLNEWYPGTKLLTDEELNMEENPLTPPGSPLLEFDETFRITRTFSTVDASPQGDLGEQEEPEDDLRQKMDLSIQRKVSMVSIGTDKGDDTEKELTPPRSAPSPIIIVTNLVRPFTVPQLRELLQRTGNVLELWVDKIKSKCVAKYDTEDAALETRTALHGVRWPTSNPKRLSVDYTTDKIFDDLRRKDSGDMRMRIEEKPEPSQRQVAVREWDMGKKRKSRSPVDRKRSASRSRDRDHDRDHDRDRKRSRRHSHSPLNERDRKDQSGETKKKPEPSGKALDELFRKTVATPFIYWLPLNPQQIAEKEELRRKRMEERERRIAEIQKHRQR